MLHKDKPDVSKPLVVIVGPTASGKSDLAVELAQSLDGEVVSGDSMQVYRHFNIGTGKMTLQEQRGVPHHLLDIIEPTEPFSAARFVELADAAIAEIRQRGRWAIIAGGTGLYIKALLHGLFQSPPKDEALRERHRRIRKEHGLEALYQQLAAVDSEAAGRINPHDFVRISRALEVYEQTGMTISKLQSSHGFSKSRYAFLTVGIAPERPVMRQRIEKRVDQMMAQGWLEEARHLIEAGYGETQPMGALGYRHLRAFLRGELDLEEAVRQTKRDTCRFARRQLTWFLAVPGVRWVKEGKDVDGDEIRGQLRELCLQSSGS